MEMAKVPRDFARNAAITVGSRIGSPVIGFVTGLVALTAPSSNSTRTADPPDPAAAGKVQFLPVILTFPPAYTRSGTLAMAPSLILTVSARAIRALDAGEAEKMGAAVTATTVTPASSTERHLNGVRHLISGLPSIRWSASR